MGRPAFLRCDRILEKNKLMEEDLFWPMDAEVSVHGWLHGFGSAEQHRGQDVTEQAVHLLAAEEQKEKTLGSQYPLQGHTPQ
jgi:hypothetical protein